MKIQFNLKYSVFILGIIIPALSAAEVEFYGQINRGILFADDGHEKNTFFVDSAYNGSLAGITGNADLNDKFKIGGKLELAVVSGATNTTGNHAVNQLNKSGSTNFLDISIADSWFKGDFGKISLGKGDMASKDSGTVTLSGTELISYAGASDMAGGMYFHPKGLDRQVQNTDNAKDPQIGSNDCIFDALSGFYRQDRLRYDSPKFKNLVLSTSVGNTSNKYLSDLALTYDNSFGGFNIQGAAAIAKQSKDSDIKTQKIYNGSFAVLHIATGLNVAASIGKQQNKIIANTADEDALNKNRNFYYLQLGEQTNLTTYGKTNFAIDYWQAKHSLEDYDKAYAYGVGVVQNLDKINTAIYCGIKNYKYNTLNIPYNNVLAILLGVKISFASKLQT